MSKVKLGAMMWALMGISGYAYAGDACIKNYYCYHRCDYNSDGGGYYPAIKACGQDENGDWTLLYNPASPTINCESVMGTALEGHPHCYGFEEHILIDQSVVTKGGKYKCTGPSKNSNGSLPSTIREHCPQS